MKKLALTLLALQVLGGVVMMFGDIGFDKPGRFGLDFEDLLLIAVAEAGLSIALVALSIAYKRWWPALASLGVLMTGVALVFLFL